MKNILSILILLIIGGLIGYFIAVRSTNNAIQKRFKEITTKDSTLQIEVDIKNKRIESLTDSVSALDSALIHLNGELALERLNEITPERIQQLEQFILSRGPELYGMPNIDNSDRALIASYGANGLKEVEISRAMIKQQKVIIVNQAGVVRLKNEIIVEYREGLEFAAKKCKKNQVAKGVGIGAVGVILLILLL